MDSIGAEVGHKMRVSSLYQLETKLNWQNFRVPLRLNLWNWTVMLVSTLNNHTSSNPNIRGLFPDEELPDYIMVMVANRRSKSQMTEDLNLFLSAKTSTFVNWLHIVLKKLKEVTVTNPEVYQKALKRKNDVPVDDKSSLKVKKEKSHKKVFISWFVK